MKHAIKRIHFVGIGGSGMSGIAEVLFNLGYQVSGSDLSPSANLERLRTLGIHTHIGHLSENIAGADVVVISTAVAPGNPEVISARQNHIPVVSRATMLAELMRLKQGIAIAGTHGKTTTTSLIASILAQAGLDPTYVIGGLLNSAGANAKLGSGDYIVVEADESDASFLNLLPTLAVVTNIDADHMETYGHDLARLKQAFIKFLNKMPFYGTAILCGDDAGVRDIVGLVSRPITLYGFNANVQVRATNVTADGQKMHFLVQRPQKDHRQDLPITLNLAGKHNVLNALAAIAVADRLGIEDAAVQQALTSFGGVGRRFQGYGEVRLLNGGTATLIDDYGHHPVEIAATIGAARGAYPNRRLLLAFQPHRFTRTRDCFEAFVDVLGLADVVLLTDVYAAGEGPIAGADAHALTRAIQVNGKTTCSLVQNVNEMPRALLSEAKNDDVLLCMGAGSIGHLAAKTLELAKVYQ